MDHRVEITAAVITAGETVVPATPQTVESLLFTTTITTISPCPMLTAWIKQLLLLQLLPQLLWPTHPWPPRPQPQPSTVKQPVLRPLPLATRLAQSNLLLTHTTSKRQDFITKHAEDLTMRPLQQGKCHLQPSPHHHQVRTIKVPDRPLRLHRQRHFKHHSNKQRQRQPLTKE